MRCPKCRSYIPEGLQSPAVCPACGAVASETTSTQDAHAGVGAPAHDNTTEAAPSAAFAPFFTIKTRLGFGEISTILVPSDGSVSFGPEGFSVVWDNGRGWEKIHYRDLRAADVVGDSVRLTLGGTERKLTLFHSWLPAWSGSVRSSRAQTFVELLTKVRAGLSPDEIAGYQQKLG